MELADRVGSDHSTGWPRTNTVALTARAMHDALNAVEPRYARWLPGTKPPAAGATPNAALCVAARTVLARRSGSAEARTEVEALLAVTLAVDLPNPARDAGVALGTAVGTATLDSAGPNPPAFEPFPVSEQPGRWRSTAVDGRNAVYYLDPPFLFPGRDALRGPPPPDLASPRYREVLDETRRLGGAASTARTAAQADIARFWIPQSLHRNLMTTLLRRLAARPPRGGLWDEARMASILAVAHADTDVMVYGEKAGYAFWRPVTAIGVGSPGIPADPLWQPFLGTPIHPEYPSGHSADMATGTAVIAGLLGEGPIRYEVADRPGHPTREFPSLAAMLKECSESRIWAGAHFRTACEEGERIGRAIAARALAQVPPLDVGRTSYL